jgi:hypothetical protein
LLHKELQQRLAKEYRYAATKMQGSSHPMQKLYYFSVLFGEAQRILNWEWDRDVALIHMVTQQAYNQLISLAQNPIIGSLPIEWPKVYEKLTQTTSDLATYMEKTGDTDNIEELCGILGRLAEITYAVSGNGAYLYEKGLIKL